MRPIDADKAKETLEEIKKRPRMRRDEIYIIAARATICEILDDEPTVDSVVHGHWIFKDSTGGGFTEPIDTYICSKCGKVSEMSCAYISKDNFCKNCGAKMDEDTEGEHETD